MSEFPMPVNEGGSNVEVGRPLAQSFHNGLGPVVQMGSTTGGFLLMEISQCLKAWGDKKKTIHFTVEE